MPTDSPEHYPEALFTTPRRERTREAFDGLFVQIGGHVGAGPNPYTRTPRATLTAIHTVGTESAAVWAELAYHPPTRLSNAVGVRIGADWLPQGTGGGRGVVLGAGIGLENHGAVPVDHPFQDITGYSWVPLVTLPILVQAGYRLRVGSVVLEPLARLEFQPAVAEIQGGWGRWETYIWDPATQQGYTAKWGSGFTARIGLQAGIAF